MQPGDAALDAGERDQCGGRRRRLPPERLKGEAMPYVRVEMLEGRSEEAKAKIAKAVTDALVEHGGATPASVFVVFQDVPKSDWAVGGTLISQRSKPAT
jgi:4-oxalocrotonate tautomerase